MLIISISITKVVVVIVLQRLHHPPHRPRHVHVVLEVLLRRQVHVLPPPPLEPSDRHPLVPLNRLQPLGVVDLELPEADLLRPLGVVLHDQVQRLVSHLANLRVLVVEQVDEVRDHLGVVEEDVSRRLVLQAAEEGVGDLQHDLVVLLLVRHEVIEHGDQLRVREDGSALGVADARADEDDDLEHDIILARSLRKVHVQEVDQVVVDQDLRKGDLGHGHVPQDPQQLHQQVRVLSLTNESRQVGDELGEAELHGPVVLGEVAQHLGEQRVFGLEEARHEAVEVLPLRHGLRVPHVARKVDGEGDERLLDQLLGEVLDHVDNHGDAVGVGEHALALVVHGDVVEQLQADVPKLRAFEHRDELGDDAVLDHVGSDLRVEGEVEHEPHGRHCHLVAVVGEEADELGGDAALSHLVLVLLEDGELLEESDGQHQQLLALAGQHLDQQLRDPLLLHLLLDCDVFGDVE
mmetsp:Transcript_52652/g.163393  ORF Transcript_52652/g.163393 Transcript_52652/m.163393 type:complete len:463 (-) Transcript_52652:851-2239(-)